MKLQMTRTLTRRGRAADIDALSTRINSLKDQLCFGDVTQEDREYLNERIAHWRWRLALILSAPRPLSKVSDSKS
jgi:hypothetical protein